MSKKIINGVEAVGKGGEKSSPPPSAKTSRNIKKKAATEKVPEATSAPEEIEKVAQDAPEVTNQETEKVTEDAPEVTTRETEKVTEDAPEVTNQETEKVTEEISEETKEEAENAMIEKLLGFSSNPVDQVLDMMRKYNVDVIYQNKKGEFFTVENHAMLSVNNKKDDLFTYHKNVLETQKTPEA